MERMTIGVWRCLGGYTWTLRSKSRIFIAGGWAISAKEAARQARQAREIHKAKDDSGYRNRMGDFQIINGWEK